MQLPPCDAGQPQPACLAAASETMMQATKGALAWEAGQRCPWCAVFGSIKSFTKEIVEWFFCWFVTVYLAMRHDSFEYYSAWICKITNYGALLANENCTMYALWSHWFPCDVHHFCRVPHANSQSSLRSCGFCTGLLTSPYLLDVCERFWLNE